MNATEIEKWKTILQNWDNVKGILQSSAELSTDEANGEIYTRYQRIIQSVDEEYAQFLANCCRNLDNITLHNFINVYRDLPIILSKSIELISLLSEQSIQWLIELLFKYHSLCQSFSDNSESIAILEEEFIQRGYEWSCTCIDECISKCSYISLEPDSSSELKYSLLHQILVSIPPQEQQVSPPSSLSFLSSQTSSFLSQFKQFKLFFHSSFHSNRTNEIKEVILHLSTFFSSCSFDEQTILLSLIEYNCFDQFATFEGTEARFLQQLLCSLSPSLPSFQFHSYFPYDIDTLLSQVSGLFSNTVFEPGDIYKYEQNSIFLSRKMEFQMKLVLQLMKKIDPQLIAVLLCLWGVFPCQDYQYSLQSLFTLLQTSFPEDSFYDTFFSIQFKEGVSLTHYYIILIILFLTDSRSASLSHVQLSSSLFSKEEVSVLKVFCSLIEIRRDYVLSEFPSMNEVSLTSRLTTLFSLLDDVVL